MTYIPNGFPASGHSRISGASLAQKLRRMPLPARAVLGAKILDGNVTVQNLTIQTVADLVNVSVSSLLAAARATPAQRMEIEAGRRSLTRPRQQLALPAPTKPLLPVPVVVSADVDDATVVNIVRVIGVQRTLDAAVAVEAAE